MREVEVSGREALLRSCDVLRRARQQDLRAGVWEPADLQWWWRTERSTDALPQTVLVDGDGPVATARLTQWQHALQLDVHRVVHAGIGWAQLADPVWEQLERGTAEAVECLVRDDDVEAITWLEARGFVEAEGDHQGWLAAGDRPTVPALPDGYAITDRTARSEGAHPFVARSGPEVEERLQSCPLYDPRLDLVVLAADGTVAGSSLYWADRATGIGLVEPVRIEDAHAGQGLGYAMVATGIERLAGAGAALCKVAWGTERAGDLYARLGFGDAARCAGYRWERAAAG